MSIFFQGAIVSVRVEDYQNHLNHDELTLGKVVSLSTGRDKGVEPNEGETRAKIDQLVETTEAHIRQYNKQRLPKKSSNLWNARHGSALYGGTRRHAH